MSTAHYGAVAVMGNSARNHVPYPPLTPAELLLVVCIVVSVATLLLANKK